MLYLRLIGVLSVLCLVGQAVVEARYEADTVDSIKPMEDAQKSRQVEITSPFVLNLEYHNYEQMTELLKNVSGQYPDMVKLYSIGTSVEGRQLWVVKVSNDVNGPDKLLKPHVKLIANMHGNEAIGRELLIQLLVYFVNSHSRNAKIHKLLDDTYIHLMPSMNPDGFEVAVEGRCSNGPGRANANGYDLNRNFPDFFAPKNYNPKDEQPETRAMRLWLNEIPFALSANLHGGALVASYPFDNQHSMAAGAPGSSPRSTSPDDDVFKSLAETYSFNHQTMHLGEACPEDSRGFPNGTTNGAEWYFLEGGMQDYNYFWNGCMEVTLEVSCCKYPPMDQLRQFWIQNKKALLAFIDEVNNKGVRGLLTTRGSGEPVADATLKIKDRNFSFRSSGRGEFWRILLPGDYEIQVSANGYKPANKTFSVMPGKVANLKILMDPM